MTGKDSSEAYAIACQNCAVYSVFPLGMTSHSKIAQFNWQCIAPLTFPQLDNKSPAFRGTQMFITVFTTAGRLSLFCARWIRPARFQPTISIYSLLLPSHPHLDLPSDLFLPVFPPPKRRTQLYSPPYVPHALPISSSLVWSTVYYLPSSTDHEVPHHAVFSILLLPAPFRPKYVPQHTAAGCTYKCFIRRLQQEGPVP